METFHEFLRKYPHPSSRQVRNYNRQIDKSVRRGGRRRK